MNQPVQASEGEPALLRQDRDGVAFLTLNRPNKFNALSVDLLTALQSEFDNLAEDRSVKTIVISGNGKAFCAGHDLKEMRANPEQDDIQALFEQCAKMMVSITRLPQPVIAAVHGIATAAGCQLVAQCDLAIAAKDAQFATSGINVGLFCSTPMVAVTRNMPRKQAMEMLMTGDFIDAPTAKSYGLINDVVEANNLEQAVGKMAGKIASKSPASIAFGKKLFYGQLEQGLEEAYRMAADVMTCNMKTRDAQDGIDAFIGKQPMPQWKGK